MLKKNYCATTNIIFVNILKVFLLIFFYQKLHQHQSVFCKDPLTRKVLSKPLKKHLQYVIIQKSKNVISQEISKSIFFIMVKIFLGHKSKLKSLPSSAKEYLDFGYSYSLQQMISVPTRITENTATLIDHALTNSLHNKQSSNNNQINIMS